MSLNNPGDSEIGSLGSMSMGSEDYGLRRLNNNKGQKLILRARWEHIVTLSVLN